MREEKKMDKVTAIYRAIEEMVAEGADLASMRVSDIAAKAGIGKGTTYEYFASKEEMIVKAMIFLMETMVNRIQKKMEGLSTFQEKFILLLDEMEEKVKQRACVLKYLTMLSDLNLCQQMHDVLSKDTEAKKTMPMRIIQYLIEEGKKEGVLACGYSQSYMEAALFSRIIAFVMYIDDDLAMKEVSSIQMKKELYLGVCRELGA